MAEFDSDADIFDQTRGGPNSERGSRAFELHRVSETDASQSIIKPGTSCTAGQHFMQTAI